MNELIIKNDIKIEDMIYVIRGRQVMLDSDLAMLYMCINGTKEINKAVHRNIKRFPSDFYFQLTKTEYMNLKFQIGTSSWNTYGGVRKLPYVFTEQGVAMLASTLKSDVAINISIKIIRTFVSMRKYIASNDYNNRINNIEIKLIDHDNKFDTILAKMNKTVNNHIFYEGQIYDAYSLMMNILSESKEEIIIIYNYAGIELFNLIKDIRINIKVYSREFDIEALKKYKKQYGNIEIIHNTSFHDRFIIIDSKILYHCGSSFKDLGKKCFAISLIEDNNILKSIFDYLNK